MIRKLFGLALAALAFAAPAGAQELWRHDGSGVSIARQIGAMRLRDESDNSAAARTDMFLQFGTSDQTTVTFYVYRPPYPNVALWFERTRISMATFVGSGDVPAAPRSFTLTGARAPNGLREELEVRQANMMSARATAVAMAQVGEWIVKVRVSSRVLDRAGVAAVVDEILAAVRVEPRQGAVLPLRIPGPCPDSNRMTAAALGSVEANAVAAAADRGRAVEAEMRGRGGLAANPQDWCCELTEPPPQYGSVYRRRVGTGWVALLGDSAYAVSAEWLRLPGTVNAAVFAGTSASAHVATLYDGLPHPDPAIIAALPVLTGEQRGLADISPLN
jgi:hypothetical protein